MVSSSLTIAELLLNFYNERHRENPSYSKRAFARDLGVSSGRLTEILQGKSIPTSSSLRQIQQRLSLSEEQYRLFITAAGLSKEKKQKQQEPVVLGLDQLSVISEWEHFAILSLMKTKRFKSDPKWIAKRLGIEVARVHEALRHLEEAQLISQENAEIRPTVVNITTTQDIPSEVIRKSHAQKIELALKSLWDVPVQWRDISSITMPINLEDLTTAKKMIIEFRRKMAKTFDASAKSEVYCLNIQLFPLTIIDTEQDGES